MTFLGKDVITSTASSIGSRSRKSRGRGGSGGGGGGGNSLKSKFFRKRNKKEKSLKRRSISPPPSPMTTEVTTKTTTTNSQIYETPISNNPGSSRGAEGATANYYNNDTHNGNLALFMEERKAISSNYSTRSENSSLSSASALHQNQQQQPLHHRQQQQQLLPPFSRTSLSRFPSARMPQLNAPSFTAPSFTAPSFNAPSFNAPSFNAPSFNAPSFNIGPPRLGNKFQGALGKIKHGGSNRELHQPEVMGGDSVEPMEGGRGSFLAQTRIFRRICNYVFDIIDTNSSGTIDEKDFFSGILLIHLKIGTFAGPTACKPLSRKQCRKLFFQFDRHGSGTLNREEFTQVMILLFSNVLLRVSVMWLLTILIVPMIAKTSLDVWIWLNNHLLPLLLNLLWHYLFHSTANNSTSPLVASWEDPNPIDWTITSRPSLYKSILSRIIRSIYVIVPETFIKSIPLTFAACILGILIVPLTLFQIDEIIQKRAETTNQNKTKEKLPVTTHRY